MSRSDAALVCSTCNLPALVTPVYGQRGDVRVTVGIVVSCSCCGAVARKGARR